MSSLPSNSDGPFLPASIILPYDQDQLYIRLTEFLNQIAYCINVRELSLFSTVELINGQVWFESAGAYRTAYIITPLVAPGTTSVPHEFGEFIAAGTFALLPTSDISINVPTTPLFVANPNDAFVSVDAVNVNVVTTNAAYNGGTAIVLLEYLKN